MRKALEDSVVEEVVRTFRTFGGDRDESGSGNPVAVHFQGKAPFFAMGVDVREVVQFVAKRVISGARKAKK